METKKNAKSAKRRHRQPLPSQEATVHSDINTVLPDQFTTPSDEEDFWGFTMEAAILDIPSDCTIQYTMESSLFNDDTEEVTDFEGFTRDDV